MFDRLVASDAQHPAFKSNLPVVVCSILFHGGVVFGGVQLTDRSAAPALPAIDVDTIPWLLPKPKETKPAPKPPAPAVVRPPLPLGFQETFAPPVVPADIPPIDLTITFDPRNYTGVGVAGGIFDGIPDIAEVADLSTPREAGEVDEPPVRLFGPPLHYPELLRQAGLEGTVVLEFIVDTSGAVMPDDIVVIQATHEGFVSDAIDVVRKSRFRSGWVRSVPVPVRVRQTISFVITRDR